LLYVQPQSLTLIDFTVTPRYKLKYPADHSRFVRNAAYPEAIVTRSWVQLRMFVNDLDNPTSTPPRHTMHWQRLPCWEGRSLVWCRQSYRFGETISNRPSPMVYGIDWPIAYVRSLLRFYDS